MDATFKSIFKCPLAASTCVDLGFDDELVCSQRSGDFFSFFGSGCDASRTVGNAEFVEEFFSLVFVDIHLADLRPCL